MIERFTDNCLRTDDLLPQMAGVYQRAFAEEPWLEVSKCINNMCSADMDSCPIGSACDECGQRLVPAYDAKELVEGWSGLLNEGGSWLEVVTVRGYLHPGNTSA